MPEINPDAIRLEGLDDAIVGIAYVPCSGAVFVYDREKCIQVTMQGQKWDYDEAVEWLDFNTFDAHLGKHTPVFLESIPDDDPKTEELYTKIIPTKRKRLRS